MAVVEPIHLWFDSVNGSNVDTVTGRSESAPRKCWEWLFDFRYKSYYNIDPSIPVVCHVKAGGRYPMAITQEQESEKIDGIDIPLESPRQYTFERYGEGPDPIIDLFKTINVWTQHAPNIWKTHLLNTTHYTGYTAFQLENNYNVGFLEVGTELYGDRRHLMSELNQQWRFFVDGNAGSTVDGVWVSNPNRGMLYVYSAFELMPGAVKVATREEAIKGYKNMTLRGIVVEGCGGNGFNADHRPYNGTNATNILVEDCHMRKIGGSYLKGDTKYGNAFQFFAGAKNCIVRNSTAYEIYDTPFTVQENGVYENVLYENCSSDKTAQGPEVWGNAGIAYRGVRFRGIKCTNVGRNALFPYRRQDAFGPNKEPLDQLMGVGYMSYTNETPSETDLFIEECEFVLPELGLMSISANGWRPPTRNNIITLKAGQLICPNAYGQLYNAAWVNTPEGIADFQAATGMETGSTWLTADTTPPDEPPIDEPPTEEPTDPTPPTIRKIRLRVRYVTDTPPVEEPGEPAVRVTGDIMPYIIPYANNTGDQDFAWASDGNDFAKGYHTSDSAKARGPEDEYFFEIPQELNATVTSIKLGDGQGSSDQPTRFDGIYKNSDGTFTRVADIIPAYYGSQYNAIITNNVAPANSKLFALVTIVKMTDLNNTWSMVPTEYEIIAEYTPFTRQPAPRPITKFQNMGGAVTYPWNTVGNNDAPADPAKLAVKQALHVERLYIDTNDVREPDGSYGISPLKDGGFSIDEILRNNTLNGIHTIICLKGEDRGPDYVPILYNMAARWGDNPNIDPATLNIRTVKNDWRPLPEIKVGLNYDISFQIGNELQGHWKADAMKAFECAELHARAYTAIKSVSQNIEVVTCGFALRAPGYLHAMNLWFKMYNNGVRAYDAFAYHYYCNEKGGQHAGATGALPPEMTSFYQDAKAIINAMYIGNPELSPKVIITETGYSIQSETPGTNPEQAVKAIGDKDVFEVAADLTMRTELEALRAGLYKQTFYQLYDDSLYYQQPKGTWLNWDLSNGIAYRDDNEHKRRPATDYMLQSYAYLLDYDMTTEADRTQEVWVDTFTKAGSPTVYSLVVPTYEGKVVANYPLQVGNASSATIIRFVPGSDNASETTVAVTNGIVLVEASEAVTLVRVNTLA